MLMFTLYNNILLWSFNTASLMNNVIFIIEILIHEFFSVSHLAKLDQISKRYIYTKTVKYSA